MDIALGFNVLLIEIPKAIALFALTCVTAAVAFAIIDRPGLAVCLLVGGYAVLVALLAYGFFTGRLWG